MNRICVFTPAKMKADAELFEQTGQRPGHRYHEHQSRSVAERLVRTAHAHWISDTEIVRVERREWKARRSGNKNEGWATVMQLCAR